jgi:hypothetical protein
MKHTRSTTLLLLLALAATGAGAEGINKFAIQSGTGSAALTPGRYDFSGAEEHSEIQNGTYRDFRASVDGLSGAVLTDLNDLLAAELEQALQQREPMITAKQQ